MSRGPSVPRPAVRWQREKRQEVVLGRASRSKDVGRPYSGGSEGIESELAGDRMGPQKKACNAEVRGIGRKAAYESARRAAGFRTQARKTTRRNGIHMALPVQDVGCQNFFPPVPQRGDTTMRTGRWPVQEGDGRGRRWDDARYAKRRARARR